jgi:maleylpyruvate isomerase
MASLAPEGNGMAPVTLSLERLTTATDELLGQISGLAEADVREPSLLPGWTRGHVLSHLARDAEGGTRLLGWARTGIAAAPRARATGPAPPCVQWP